jgi:hypothetical protein
VAISGAAMADPCNAAVDALCVALGTRRLVVAKHPGRLQDRNSGPQFLRFAPDTVVAPHVLRGKLKSCDLAQLG